MKTYLLFLLIMLFFFSCKKCYLVALVDTISGFKFVNFSPKDIDTVYFLSCKPGQFASVNLKEHTNKSQRYINQANDSLFDIGINGMTVNSEMHIFASDTNLHFIVRPSAITVKEDKCGSNSYIDSVSVNNIPQTRTGKILITK